MKIGCINFIDMQTDKYSVNKNMKSGFEKIFPTKNYEKNLGVKNMKSYMKNGKIIFIVGSGTYEPVWTDWFVNLFRKLFKLW